MNESFFTKFRIPTLLGLALILFSTGAGIYLVLQGQNLSIKAVDEGRPENVIISNLDSDSTTISWQTSIPTLGSISYKPKDASEKKVAIDTRDSKKPVERKLHYVTLKDLSPKTNYQFKITSGKFTSEDYLEFTTAPETTVKNGFNPIIGTVIDDQSNPLEEGVVYISIPGMIDQSATMSTLGNFLVPISEARRENDLEIFQPKEGQEVKIKVFSESGKIASGNFDLTPTSKPVGPLILGWGVNLNKGKQATTSAQLKFDLNNDGIINTTDHSIVLNNFGRNPKEKRADLNEDGIVNAKDIDLILSQLNETGN